MQQSKVVKEGELFFRQWLRSPKSMGSIIPSSKYLARAMAEEVAWTPGQHIVELGGGTGAITQGLIDRGIPREKLVVIELERALYEHLRRRLPGTLIIQGDATKLDEILARHGIKHVGTVISGIPMVWTYAAAAVSGFGLAILTTLQTVQVLLGKPAEPTVKSGS